MAWYATLAERGYFAEELLETYAQDGSRLGEHPSRHCVPGIDVSTGSLGHGLGIGLGRGYSARQQRMPHRVFVLLSDGECEEGSVWESAMVAAHQRLDNLIALVDYNKIQATGFTDETSSLAPLAEKWRAFGWEVRETGGHDIESLRACLAEVPFRAGQPSAILAHTVKGKGVSFMENDVEWHYRSPDVDELADALTELEQSCPGLWSKV
jgi:transketolase